MSDARDTAPGGPGWGEPIPAPRQPKHMAPPMEEYSSENAALDIARSHSQDGDTKLGIVSRALLQGSQTSLSALMEAQAELQRGSFQDIYTFDSEQRMEFIRWNVLALTDELHEMLAECGWKPWATSRHVNPIPALKELVDAFHFFMNLAIAVAGYDESDVSVTPRDIGEALANLYFQKREVNATRQVEGYTGLEKCPSCKRDASFLVKDYLGVFCSGCKTRVSVSKETT